MASKQDASAEKDIFIINQDDVIEGPLIGEGEFGEVYKAEYKGDAVAVKRQSTQDENIPNKKVCIERELSTLKQLSSPFIVKFLGGYREYFEAAGEVEYVCFVFEYVEGGDLTRVLRTLTEPMPWCLKAKLIYEAAMGICALHSRGLVHRDIKSANYLVTSSWGLKLTDFGFAREVTDGDRRITLCGTDLYMAPEASMAEGHEEDINLFACDIYSLGLVMLEIVRGQPVGNGFAERHARNFCEMDPEALEGYLADCQQTSAKKAYGYLNDVAVVVKQCLDSEPGSRPEWETLQDHVQVMYVSSLECRGSLADQDRPHWPEVPPPPPVEESQPPSPQTDSEAADGSSLRQVTVRSQNPHSFADRSSRLDTEPMDGESLDEPPECASSEGAHGGASLQQAWDEKVLDAMDSLQMLSCVERLVQRIAQSDEPTQVKQQCLQQVMGAAMEGLRQVVPGFPGDQADPCCGSHEPLNKAALHLHEPTVRFDTPNDSKDRPSEGQGEGQQKAQPRAQTGSALSPLFMLSWARQLGAQPMRSHAAAMLRGTADYLEPSRPKNAKP